MKKSIIFAPNVNIMKTKNKITRNDYLLANKKASREEEIFEHGHSISHNRVNKSKKVYDRKKMKAGDRNLPFFMVSNLLVLLSGIRLKPQTCYSMWSESILPQQS